MKKIMMVLLLSCFICGILCAAAIIPANNPYIQYYGRWDFSNPSAPTHSWPGVYIYTEFEGTSIGITTNDNFSYYNVFIDDTIFSIFHGSRSGVASYTLVTGLPDGNHKILFTLRSETNWTKFSFNGFILDDGKNLLQPPEKPERRIEFIGDSYTVASGNEWTQTSSAPNDSYTNIYKGFGPLVARNYNAQYHISARGGAGVVIGYPKDYTNLLPIDFDRTLVYTSAPKWNFSSWVPNLVVICLGLNDYSNWDCYSGPIDSGNTVLYRNKYHEFLDTIMNVYSGVKILVVAENGYNPSINWNNGVPWLQTNLLQVVAEENALGHTNVFYGSFPYYDGTYVNQGHPSAAMHQKIADTLISIINTIDPWTPYQTEVAAGMQSILPKKMILYANYPNPFNPTTTIRYELLVKSHVSMKIFDLLGREIATLLDEVKQKGMYSVHFNAGNLSSGMYFCQLQSGHSVAVSKLMLVK
jgi:hypothetical protein